MKLIYEKKNVQRIIRSFDDCAGDYMGGLAGR